MFTLETERLRLREWREGDWEALRPMHNDPEVMKFLGGELLNDEKIQSIERWMLEEFEKSGFCYWIVELKETEETIGLCGVTHKTDDDYYDYGWRIAREHWSRGYVTEAAGAVKKYAFDTLNLPKLTSTALTENVGSINVMKKMGMQYIEDFDTQWGLSVRYELENPGVGV